MRRSLREDDENGFSSEQFGVNSFRRDVVGGRIVEGEPQRSIPDTSRAKPAFLASDEASGRYSVI